MTTRELAITAVILLLASAGIYYVHYLIFHDVHHIFLYLIGDIAFVFVEVLMVTLVIDRVLRAREKRSMEHKMNMVIGAFFASMGSELLRRLAPMIDDIDTIRERMAVTMKSTAADLRAAADYARATDFTVTLTAADLKALQVYLREHIEFVLRLLENPVLLEHDRFTDVLWAISHLGEELLAREDLDALPTPDLKHLGGDVDRAFTRLLTQWTDYLLHLRADYPYLYSFAARNNPLRAERSVLVTD